MKRTHEAIIYGQKFEMSANWADATSNIEVNGDPTQWQVSDFSHRPTEGMRRILSAFVQDCGDDPESTEFSADIDLAIDRMKPIE